MIAFARFKNETRCLDMEYAAEKAKKNTGVLYPLDCQDWFDRTVDAKRIKTKNSKQTVRAFQFMITRRIGSEKLGWQGSRI